jgi:hypothetical protein
LSQPSFSGKRIGGPSGDSWISVMIAAASTTISRRRTSFLISSASCMMHRADASIATLSTIRHRAPSPLDKTTATIPSVQEIGRRPPNSAEEGLVGEKQVTRLADVRLAFARQPFANRRHRNHCFLFRLSKKKPAGVNRRAAAGAACASVPQSGGLPTPPPPLFYRTIRSRRQPVIQPNI